MHTSGQTSASSSSVVVVVVVNIIIIIIGLNKNVFIHRNHKLNKQVQETQKQYAYLLPIDKMIITQILTMARWQIVVKTSEATKQRKTKMTTKNKQTNKQTTKQKQQQQNGRRGAGVEKANN